MSTTAAKHENPEHGASDHGDSDHGDLEHGDAALHQRVDSLIASSGLDDAASATDVLATVAQRRGRVLELEPLPADVEPGHVFGLCLPYPDRDVIFFRTGAGSENELHTTLH